MLTLTSLPQLDALATVMLQQHVSGASPSLSDIQHLAQALLPTSKQHLPAAERLKAIGETARRLAPCTSEKELNVIEVGEVIVASPQEIADSTAVAHAQFKESVLDMNCHRQLVLNNAAYRDTLETLNDGQLYTYSVSDARKDKTSTTQRLGVCREPNTEEAAALATLKAKCRLLAIYQGPSYKAGHQLHGMCVLVCVFVCGACALVLFNPQQQHIVRTSLSFAGT